ncbi:hypothetical protein SCUP234_13347 [Seiridium cupressi]
MVGILKSITALVALVASTPVLAVEWPYWDDSSFYSALTPLPEDVDTFTAFKKVFLSAKNDTLAWWYMGLSMPVPDGLPWAPGIKSQTIQAWRTQQLSPTRFRADWSEIIILADFQSGEDASSYYNPMSGVNATVPNYYYDGPITYYYEKNGSDISVEMIQPAANITKVSVTSGLYNDTRVLFRQVEDKIKSGSHLVSTLIGVGDLEDVRSCKTNVPARGYYAASINGTISSIFGYPSGTQGQTLITGNMDKGGASDPLQYPALWEHYQEMFPDFFQDGRISPNWTSILTTAGLDP